MYLLEYLFSLIYFRHFLLFIMTNSFSSVSSEFHSLLYPIFSKINNENWDQGNGYICPGERKYKCCIGAHIAKEFGIIDKSLGEHSFLDGKEYIYTKFKITSFQLNAIFHCGGSPMYPFGGEEWKNHPLFVLYNVRFIETYPPKIDYDKCMENKNHEYYDQDNVKEWLRIERKRIEIGKEREKLLCKV